MFILVKDYNFTFHNESLIKTTIPKTFVIFAVGSKYIYAFYTKNYCRIETKFGNHANRK